MCIAIIYQKLVVCYKFTQPSNLTSQITFSEGVQLFSLMGLCQNVSQRYFDGACERAIKRQLFSSPFGKVTIFVVQSVARRKSNQKRVQCWNTLEKFYQRLSWCAQTLLCFCSYYSACCSRKKQSQPLSTFAWRRFHKVHTVSANIGQINGWAYLRNLMCGFNQTWHRV